jgi:hypothetical protein
VAMGKHHEALEWECQTHQGWDLALIWLRAEALHHLVVLDADRLAPSLCRLLVQLSAELRLHLWLVVRNPADPSPLELLGLWREWTIAELLGRLPHAHIGSTAGSLEDEIRLPGDGFLTFRASCSERLTPKRFATVDALYREAFQAARRWNREMPHHDRAPAIAQQLRTLTVHSTSAAETRVRLLAAQAAHFLDGTLIKLRPATRPGLVDVPHVGLSRHLAVRLRRIATPAWACALALSAATAHADDVLVGLKMSDLSADGRRVVLDGERFDVPAHAAALVRAKFLLRHAAGARRGHHLFVDGQGRRYRSGRHLRDGLEQAAERGAVWWSGARRWPLREDHMTSGYAIDVHRMDARRSVAARVLHCVDACRCRDPELDGVPAPPVAEAPGLVQWHQGRLRPSPRVAFSLCLTDDPPSRGNTNEVTAPGSDWCTATGLSGDLAWAVSPNPRY